MGDEYIFPGHHTARVVLYFVHYAESTFSKGLNDEEFGPKALGGR